MTVQPSARACDRTSIRNSVHLSIEFNVIWSMTFSTKRNDVTHQLSRVSGSSELLMRSSNLTDRALTVPPEILTSWNCDPPLHFFEICWYFFLLFLVDEFVGFLKVDWKVYWLCITHKSTIDLSLSFKMV